MNKLLHFIGIANRAKKVQKGAFLAEKAIKNGTALLVIAASDTSDNTKDKFASMCKYYEVQYLETETKESLGLVTGGADNRSVLAIAFAKNYDSTTVANLCDEVVASNESILKSLK